MSLANPTYRVAGLPSGVSREEAVAILRSVLDTDDHKTGPMVHSLGYDPYSFGRAVDMVATVTFRKPPQGFNTNPPREFRTGEDVQTTVLFRQDVVTVSLNFDTDFLGFTPLNDVKDDADHQIDCIVVSGLASHPFGSWKARGGQFMWLRDAANWRTPGVRVLLFGYDTALVHSESFQNIDDIGGDLASSLAGIRSFRPGEINFEPRPIVFIAHSLGGLVVKEAIYSMFISQDDTERLHARCIYGLLFFGVPNRGIRVDQWLPIVNGQPNSELVGNLRPGSSYLNNLQRNFDRCFQDPNSKILSMFETMMTKTARETDGKWKLDGPAEILVSRDSASNPMENPGGVVQRTLQINQNHADMVKFGSAHDNKYQSFVLRLNAIGFWKDAVAIVQARFGPQGLFTNDPYSYRSQHDLSSWSPDPLQRSRGSYKFPSPSPTLIPNDSELFTTHSQQQDLDRVAGTPEAEEGQVPVSTRTNSGVISPAAAGQDSSQTTPDINFIERRTSSFSLLEAKASRQDESVESDGTQLSYAISRGDLATVETIINSCPDELEQADGEGFTSLHLAAGTRHVDVCRLLISKGANLHATTKSGKTALHIAVTSGRYSIVDLLLDHGAEPHVLDSDGNTAVHIVPEGRHRILRLLLDKGANIDVKSSHGCTALFTAVSKGESGLVKLLLENGAETSAKQPHYFDSIDEITWTPFQIAVMSDHVEIAKILLSSDCDVRVKTSQGVSVLGLALHFGLDKMLQYLVTINGVDVDEDQSVCLYSYRSQGLSQKFPCQTIIHPPPPAGQECPLCLGELAAMADAEIWDRPTMRVCTPLAYACWKGRSAAAQILLDARANVEVTMNPLQRRPLHCAVVSGDEDTVKALLNSGANIEGADLIEATPLWIAASWGFPKMVKVLLDHGANIHAAVSPDHSTALHVAAKFYIGPGTLEVINLLVDRGANINKADATSKKLSALHLAAGAGRTETVALLLERGADPNVSASTKPYREGLPIHVAASQGHTEIVRLFLDKGVDIDVKSEAGSDTPLNCAAAEGKADVVRLLLERGARTDIKDVIWVSPLRNAQLGSHTEVVEILKAFEASKPADPKKKKKWFRS